jgi:hypothetical protein
VDLVDAFRRTMTELDESISTQLARDKELP